MGLSEKEIEKLKKEFEGYELREMDDIDTFELEGQKFQFANEYEAYLIIFRRAYIQDSSKIQRTFLKSDFKSYKVTENPVKPILNIVNDNGEITTEYRKSKF